MIDMFEGLPVWTAQAACLGAETDVFFPAKGGQGDDAKALCGRCPVQPQCLDYALSFDPSSDFGIWGGTTEKERRRLRRHREAAA